MHATSAVAKPLAVLLVLLLAGCASTQSNYASKGVLLDDGSYYFPASDGQGDYYYGHSRRETDAYFLLAYDHGPFWSSRHCHWSSWHCPRWPYGHRFGFSHGLGFDPYFDVYYGWAWHGGRHGPWYRPPRRRDGPDPRPGEPIHEDPYAEQQRLDPALDAVTPVPPRSDERPRLRERGRQRWRLASGDEGVRLEGIALDEPGADLDPAREDRPLGEPRISRRESHRDLRRGHDQDRGQRDVSRHEPAVRPVREAGNDRIRERSHDRDD